MLTTFVPKEHYFDKIVILNIDKSTDKNLPDRKLGKKVCTQKD